MPVPTKIIAGDSKTWTLDATDSSEIVTYTFRDGDGDGLNVLGVNSSGTHTFTLSPGQSAQLAPGWFDVSKVVEDGAGSRTTTTNVARTHVDPNPMVKPEDTWNRQMLDDLRRVYKARLAGNMNESGSVAGSNWSKTPTAEIYDQLQRFERRVRREELAGMAQRGRRGRNDLTVKF